MKTNWPQLRDLTEAHHVEPPPVSYPVWLLKIATRKAMESNVMLPAETFGEFVLLLAEHISDDMISRSHARQECVTIGCDRFADTPLALFCRDHSASSHATASESIDPSREITAPDGLDGFETDDPHRIPITFTEREPETETRHYKRTRHDVESESYTVQIDQNDDTLTHDWASDHIGRFTR